ncbi:flagellum-associated coiled-coil domain-containing protein 1-like isoform X3 [Mercenaria mercenaria]|uniref:flagellum-associated coiled-coil domain-containing protein 1-like isoform X3 n=1 Tax=Mercenaria mercenaria TaxID=6596 RepID=UPI00234E5050|nr:flagellum-associated coiled-coil domain-containing protein 1-like isoform X3 [Mercenaria mercenaria]
MLSFRWYCSSDGIFYRISTPAHGTRPSSYGHIVPSTANSTHTENGTHLRINRPKTAAAILGIRDCDRVSQLEHEATRRHNLEAHIPVKKNRPPPWQSKIDFCQMYSSDKISDMYSYIDAEYPPLVPFVVGPGYILSKSKAKYSVTLKDELFEPTHDEETKGRSESPYLKIPCYGETGKKHEDHERDNLISQLQERISDLTLYLEEERLNHKQTKLKGDEFLKDRVEELENAKRNAVAEKEREGEEELDKLKKAMETEHTNYKTNAEAQIARMKKEIEFLQGAFESYKSSLHQETDEKWKRKEEDLKNDLEMQKNKELQEMKQKFMQEKALEKSQWSKDQHRAIDAIRKENKREMDSLIRKFSNVAADLERLQKCTAELQETKAELAIVTERYNETCQQLAKITTTLTDTKVRLFAFEEQFDQKVQEVDEKYKQKIDELMTQNTELKRLYVSKCGELYEEKVLFERDRQERVMTAKETMHKMLQSKHKAEVNLTPGLKEIEDKQRVPKLRPGSAPITKSETQTAALSAGETEHLKTPEGDSVRPTVVLPEDSEEIEQLRKSLMKDVKSMPKEELLKTVSDTVS